MMVQAPLLISFLLLYRYIDPSYMIRSIPANAADSLYCMQLAQNAVHGAMAGFTGFSVGLCNNRMGKSIPFSLFYFVFLRLLSHFFVS